MTVDEFNIPLFQYEIDEWDLKKEALMDIFINDVEPNMDLGLPDCLVYTDYARDNVPGEEQYVVDVMDILGDEFDKFLTDLRETKNGSNRSFQLKNPYIENLWYQKYIKSHFMAPHNHGAIGFSAICYVKFDPEIHTPTIFHAPFRDIMTGEDIIYRPKVSEGTMIFFPSVLTHYALPCFTDDPRIVISLNIRSEKKDGRY